jgi:hypothetical protein
MIVSKKADIVNFFIKLILVIRLALFEIRIDKISEKYTGIERKTVPFNISDIITNFNRLMILQLNPLN